MYICLALAKNIRQFALRGPSRTSPVGPFLLFSKIFPDHISIFSDWFFAIHDIFLTKDNLQRAIRRAFPWGGATNHASFATRSFAISNCRDTRAKLDALLECSIWLNSTLIKRGTWVLKHTEKSVRVKIHQPLYHRNNHFHSAFPL